MRQTCVDVLAFRVLEKQVARFAQASCAFGTQTIFQNRLGHPRPSGIVRAARGLVGNHGVDFSHPLIECDVLRCG